MRRRTPGIAIAPRPPARCTALDPFADIHAMDSRKKRKRRSLHVGTQCAHVSRSLLQAARRRTRPRTPRRRHPIPINPSPQREEGECTCMHSPSRKFANIDACWAASATTRYAAPLCGVGGWDGIARRSAEPPLKLPARPDFADELRRELLHGDTRHEVVLRMHHDERHGRMLAAHLSLK